MEKNKWSASRKLKKYQLNMHTVQYIQNHSAEIECTTSSWKLEIRYQINDTESLKMLNDSKGWSQIINTPELTSFRLSHGSQPKKMNK